MKSLRIMLASAALILIGLASCQQKEVFTGEDSSKPGVTELAYDEINSSDDVIAFTYNNDAALKQGATSFTVQLLKKTDGSDGDNYDPALTAVVMAEDTPNSGAIIAGKKKGQKYLVRARANYARSIYSPWTWLMDGTDTAVVKVGTGVVKEDLDVLTAASAELVYATSKALNVQFSATAFIDVNIDISYPYNLYLYKDAACSNLVVSYTVTPACFSTSAEKKTVEPAFIFTCLEPATDYYLVTEYTDAVKGLMRSDAPQKFSTLPDTNVRMDSRAAGSAQPGDVILREDFSDLAWGGDYIQSATGISSADRASLDHFFVPTGDHISKSQLEYYSSAPAKGSLPDTDGFYFCPYSTEMGLFNTIGPASLSSPSIAQFYQIAENGSTWGTICAKPGYLKLGASSYMGMIVTPKMTALASPAKVRVSFRACPYGGSSLDPTRAAVVVFEGLQTNEKHYVTGALVDLGGAYTEFDLTAKYQWAEYSFEINNVLPDSQIGIGNVRRDGSSPGGKQMRMFIDDIKVEVLEYGSISLDAPTVTASATDKAITVSWEPVPMAKTYVVEYKKAADAGWTVLEATDQTSVTITGVSFDTPYQVRVKALRDAVASDYSTVDVKTMPESQIAPEVATGAEFVEWLSKANAATNDVYKITADIDMAGLEFVPSDGFTGTLDGQGHIIKNLKASTPLFKNLAGTVKNLVIDASCQFTPADDVFGIIADQSTGTITEVVNNAPVSKSVANHEGVLLVAGIVGMNKGNVTKCENKGAISLTSDAGLAGAGASGIAAYTETPISENINRGDITVKSQYTSKKAKVGAGQVDALPGVAGITVFGAPGFRISKCDNYGKLIFLQTAIDKYPSRGTANLNRHQAGGIVANPVGDVEDCNNYGDIDYKLATSDGQTMSGKNNEYIACVGGIAGGDYLSSGNNTSSIINCKNSGKINFYSDSSQSNSVVSGIIAWPGVEGAQTIKTENCVNSGDIVVSGTVKVRAGGIHGGTGRLFGCSNTGNITIESAHEGSVLGGICGFHSQAHEIENCSAVCSVTAKSKVDGIAGLIGNNGNAVNESGSGCSVNTVITSTNTTTEIGLIVGKFNGKTKEVILGPVKVAGSINGTEITASNFSEWLSKSANYDTSVHNLKAEYGK